MKQTPKALVELSLQIEDADVFCGSQLEALEKLTASFLPSVTLDDPAPLSKIATCTFMLLEYTAKAANGQVDGGARTRLVDIMCKCLQKLLEIPTLLNASQVIRAIRACGEKRLKVRTDVLQSCFKTFLSFASVEQEIDTVKETFECLNHLLQGTTRQLRNALREENFKDTKQLVDFLLICGDYSVQECVMETLTRLAPQTVRSELAPVWFKDFPSEAKDVFLNFGQTYFQIEVQLFLNSVNMRFDTKVHTFVCKTVLYKSNEMFKPDLQDHIFVNFSLGSKKISFSGLQKNLPVDDDENPLQNVDIRFSNIREAALIPTKSDSFKVLSIFFKKPIRFMRKGDINANVDVVMVLRDVDVEVLKKLLGKTLDYNPSKISDFIVQLSQDALTSRLVDSPKILQIDEMTLQREEQDATFYMYKDRDEDDDPWEKVSVESESAENFSQEQSSQKNAKRPQTPMKIPRSRVDSSPGTYADYMTVADSDENEETKLGVEEKGAMKRTATPAGGLKSSEISEEGGAIQKRRSTPIPGNITKTLEDRNRGKIAKGTPVVDKGKKRLTATPAFPRDEQSKSAKGANSKGPISMTKTPAAETKPRRKSTPAVVATEEISDSEEESGNKKSAPRRPSTPVGRFSGKEKPAKGGQPSGDIPANTASKKTADDVHHNSPESDLEDVALADRQKRKVEPPIRKPRQAKKAVDTKAKKVPAVRQPRKRRVNDSKTTNSAKYPKLDVTVRTHYSSSMASGDVDDPDYKLPLPSKVPENGNKTLRKRRLSTVDQDEDNDQSHLEAEDVFQTDRPKSSDQLPHEAYGPLENKRIQNLRTYGGDKKPVFPKYMQKGLCSKDSVFDELLSATYPDKTPSTTDKPIQYVTPLTLSPDMNAATKMPRLFDDVGLSVDIRESSLNERAVDNPQQTQFPVIVEIPKPRRKQTQKQINGRESTVKARQRRSSRTSKATEKVVKSPEKVVKPTDDSNARKIAKESNVNVEAGNKKRGGPVRKGVAGAGQMKRAEDHSESVAMEKVEKEAKKRRSPRIIAKQLTLAKAEVASPTCDPSEGIDFDPSAKYFAKNSHKGKSVVSHLEQLEKELAKMKKNFAAAERDDCMIVGAVEYKKPVVGNDEMMYSFGELFCTDDEDNTEGTQESEIMKPAALDTQSSEESAVEKFGQCCESGDLIDKQQQQSAAQTVADKLVCLLDEMSSDLTANELESSKRKKRLSSRLNQLHAAFRQEEANAKAQLTKIVVRKLVSELRKAVKEEKQNLEVINDRIELMNSLHVALDIVTKPIPKRKDRLPEILGLVEDLVDVNDSHMDDSHLIAEAEKIVAEETDSLASGIGDCFRSFVSKAQGWFSSFN